MKQEITILDIHTTGTDSLRVSTYSSYDGKNEKVYIELTQEKPVYKEGTFDLKSTEKNTTALAISYNMSKQLLLALQKIHF